MQGEKQGHDTRETEHFENLGGEKRRPGVESVCILYQTIPIIALGECPMDPHIWLCTCIFRALLFLLGAILANVQDRRGSRNRRPDVYGLSM